MSIFCPELQKLLTPIHELTKKGRPFIWGEEQQKTFEEIKNRLQKPPVLSMPDRRGRFLLYSDTSKFATGSALYPVQDGKPQLIAYVSKRMSEAAKNYSITELEMCGLAINIASFAYLLKRVDFDAVVDHLAIRHIMRSKMEPATNRIMRLLEILNSYSFNLYYIKGKDMILSDFLSRHLGDDSDPYQIIPISFHIKEILKEKYQSIVKDTYMVQTRSQTNAKAANTPAVQNATRKPATQNVILRIDKIPVKTNKCSKPNINTQTKPQDTIVNQQLPQGLVGPGNIIPISTHPIVRLLPKPPDTVSQGVTPSLNLVQNPNMDFEENSPHQEEIITETYICPDQSYIEKP